MEFRTVLKRNNLTQKLIRPHTPEQNGIVERANKTMRESLAPVMLTDYEQAKYEISRIIENYNNNRRHSSLNYLTPIQYYRGNPEELLRIWESKICDWRAEFVAKQKRPTNTIGYCEDYCYDGDSNLGTAKSY